jgi:hypothetical protein
MGKKTQSTIATGGFPVLHIPVKNLHHQINYMPSVFIMYDFMLTVHSPLNTLVFVVATVTAA